MRWAPGSTHGHLLEYVRRTDTANDRSLRLTIDSVLNSQPSTANGDATAAPSHNTVVSETSIVSTDNAPTDVSMYLTSLSQRANYLGQVQGMLSMLKSTHRDEALAREALVDHLTESFEAACAADDDAALTDAIMRISAFFVISNETNYKLLRALVWTPLRSFTESTLRLCITSWNWILVACDTIHVHVSVKNTAFAQKQFFSCTRVFSFYKKCAAALRVSHKWDSAFLRGTKTSSSRQCPIAHVSGARCRTFVRTPFGRR